MTGFAGRPSLFGLAGSTAVIGWTVRARDGASWGWSAVVLRGLGMVDNPLVLYGDNVGPGTRIEERRFAQVWESRVVILPDDFVKQFKEYCEEYELDPNDQESLRDFIAERLDYWADGDEAWEVSDRDTLDRDWDVL